MITPDSTSALTTFITTQLNDQQRQAVLHRQGSLLVVAGAGSGKTRVITARIARLLSENAIDPTAIVALTFTNKAAQEMRERIAQFLPTATALPFVGTFHAYCLRLLKLQYARLHLPTFSILDTDDQQQILHHIIHTAGIQKRVSVKQALYAISAAKNNSIDAYEHASSLTQRIVPAGITEEPLLRDIFLAYEQHKHQSNCLDFDDLLLKTVQLLATDEQCAQQLRATVRHILVDEYQDTSAIQHALLTTMTHNGTIMTADSVCVVGDEDQSIYSWRGATVENMQHFVRDFANTTIITIDQNYRSVQPILTVANHIIANNPYRNAKQLWSTRSATNRVLHLSCASGYQEGDVVAAIAQIQKEAGKIAVLYRTHFQSRVLEELLLRSRIPYTIIGGIQFYDRKEIKDILAYLRLLVNPRDRIAFGRIINVPKRKLGSATVEAIMQAWDGTLFGTYQQAIELAISNNLVTGSKAEALQEFVQLMQQFSGDSRPSAIITALISAIHYLAYLRDEYDPQEAEEKTQNIQEFLRAASFYEANGIITVTQMLDEIALMQELMHEQPKEQSKVQLMTIHAAKGLEFNTVIVTGLEEGLLPSSKTIDDENAIAEERRLLYVAVTRAQERLILTHAGYRNSYGTTVSQDPSRFLQELPRTTVLSQDIAHMRGYQVQELLQEFMLGSKRQQTTVMTFGKQEQTVTPATQIINKQESRSDNSFRKFQSVHHPIFGLGIIQAVEERGNGSAILTIRFSVGIKTIDSSFVR
ncbi:UvrD-helicase domain-containing protein [Candidatus Dependentiae bacterium]|nr:UvrD-helicase domain-containing protein [Candidatus Dependentiae bacterium]